MSTGVGPIDEAIKGAEALVTIFKTLETLPSEEARARVMALASTQLGLYDHAIAFLQAAKRFASENA